MSCETELREWYEGYLAAFTRLGRGESSRVEKLAEYFAFPSHVTSDSAHVVFTETAILTRALGAELEQLRQADYANSDVVNFTVHSLNTRTALIAGSFSRRNRHGDELAKIGVVYLVIKTDGNWRFASLTVISPFAGTGVNDGLG